MIQTRHSLKLIDLGGVYRVDDPASTVFGTVGYQAAEIAALGPSVASDLFTVARTLAVLCIDFRGYQSTYRFTLPEPGAVPLFERYDSLYRWLLRATASDPGHRFQSADEMADQLLGVLREVVADQEGRPVPGPSHLFTGALRADTERPDWRTLPRPQVSSDDPSAGYLAAITAGAPRALIAQLRAAPEQTIEVKLRLLSALVESDDLESADALLEDLRAKHPHDWRIEWYAGMAALARARPDAARARFMDVYRAAPGELAPKLALAIACEQAGDTGEAGRWYEVVARTDPSVTSASFGLARCRLLARDRAGAITAYERVPDTSSGFLDAQTARIRCVAALNGAGEPAIDELLAAGSILEALVLDGERRDRLAAELLEAALQFVLTTDRPSDQPATLLGSRVEERDLRLGLERSLRSLASRTSSHAERIRLVEKAYRARPRTWT